MANYSSLLATINANIRANNNQEITGSVLNSVLRQTVSSLGAGYQYLGLATPSTSPGTPDQKVFYIAGPGTYTNFGSTVVPDGSIGIFSYDSTWSYEVEEVVEDITVTEDATKGNVSLLKGGDEIALLADGNKLIKLSGIGTSYSLIPNPGDIMYLSSSKLLRKRESDMSVSTVPFYDGAIYVYNNNLYIYNGTDIIPVIDSNDNNNTGGKDISIAGITILKAVNAGFQLKGLADTDTEPGTPDTKVFYIASAVGTYTDFLDSDSASIVVGDNDGVVLLMYDTAWSKVVIGSATSDKFDQLNSVVNSYTLYQGYVSSAGVVVTHANRVTTGSIKAVSNKIYIACNEDLRIQIRTGASARALSTNLGVIINNGEPYILETNDPYMGVIIISTSAITPQSEIGLVIADYNSVIAVNDRKRRDAEKLAVIASLNDGMDSLFYPFIQGRRGFDGVIVSNEKVISSRILPVCGNYTAKCDDNHKMIIRYKASGESTFTELALRVTEYTFFGDGEVYILIENSDNTTSILPSAETGFVFAPAWKLAEPDLPHQITVIGDGESTAYYSAHYTLKKGVAYDVEFSSDNYVKQASASKGIVLFTYPADTEGTRTNILSVAGTLPASASTITPEEDSSLFVSCTLENGSYANIIITPRQTYYNAVNSCISDIVQTRLFRKYLIQDMFTRGNVVSDMKFLTVITDGYDIRKDTGEICIGYCGVNAYGESGTSERWSAHLAVCNLGDIEGTKVDSPALVVGETYNGYYIGQCSHVIATWTGDDEITLVALVGHASASYNGLLARQYTPSTGTWGDVYVCDVQVGDNTPIQMASLQANCEQFWTESGVEHPEGRGEVVSYTFFPAGCPIKIGDYFYLSMVCGNYSHPLLRSQDMIHYEFVSDIPYSDGTNGVYSPSEEVSICYYQDRIYALTRGNYGYFPNHPDDGWNTILYCDFDKLENGSATISDWYVQEIENCAHERTTIIGINGRIITLNGLKPLAGSNFNDSKQISARGRKNLRIYDTELNLLRSTVIDSDLPFLHPIFTNFAGTIVCVLCSDLRGFGFNNGGDTRHEIMITRLDPELLYMICQAPSE